MSEHALIYVVLIEEKPRKQRPDERADEYGRYLDRFQPWRFIAKSGDNQKKLARSSERYFQEDKARHAIDLLWGPESIIYRRQAEHGDVLLRHPEPWPAA